ncbi:hypothetical protein [Bradyrhizobium valentinum]|uniref:Uncharacterized protein n=1 Tax=Bradyrhizobium valentinum TaxID=1518501 RepID=A0A0R3L2P3_9BRAD|nr:hypothetical protein [Bradyrhizobium valentinum]KRR02097.1 hypothetical protein CP49_04765 [Bradyrhizobium valentinum]KRR09019.1 hypothetical protein CQ10_41445 [Bradyrhizobium valentinum]
MPNAYTRLVVPETPSSPLTKSSYLRLGSYSDEEEKLVTGLTATIGESPAAISKHESDNAGLLAFTNKDFQANIEGAALLKIARGQTTEVTNGNSQHQVSKGTYEISAENGVSISAGANGTPADIILTASNRVKLINNGHKLETTVGNSEKQTMGDTKEFFQGTKFTCMRGAATTLAMANNVCMFFGEAFTFKISRECSFNLSDMNSVTIGNKLDIVEGNDVKQVIGNSAKCVFGPDFKSADSDTKILRTSNFKLAPVDDLKVVGRDGKVCKMSVSVTEEELSQGKSSTEQYELVTRAAEIMSSTGNEEVIQKKSINFM